MQWRLDMIEKVRNTIASQYKDTCPVSSDGDDEAPMVSANSGDKNCHRQSMQRYVSC